MSRGAAAQRFGVAVSMAVKWLQRHDTTGSVAAAKMGVYRPRKLTGKHQEWLLERAKTDFTLRGLRAELAERGMKVDYRTLWSFVHDEGLRFKKPYFAPSNCAPRLPAGASSGKSTRARLIPGASSSSTRPRPRPTWRPCSAVPPRRNVSMPKCPMAIEKQ